jgi:DNA-directed RNA polymerase specialized sigma24 family protein
MASRPPPGLPGAADPRRDEYVRAAQASVDAAIGALDGPDRLRLRLYYAEGLTLAEIGRVFGEHEATVSRRLSRLRRSLRDTVEHELRARHGFDGAAMRLCFEYAADAPELHLTRLLSTEER